MHRFFFLCILAISQNWTDGKCCYLTPYLKQWNQVENITFFARGPRRSSPPPKKVPPSRKDNKSRDTPKTSDKQQKKPDGANFPDRPLPRDERTGEPKPDVDAPHTQLGTKEGSKGTYPQAREFDEQGKPVRDIDFTDHGRSDHKDPHQHKYIENETGGTLKRGDPEPLPQE